MISARKVTLISGRAQAAAVIDRFGFRLNQLILRPSRPRSSYVSVFVGTGAAPTQERYPQNVVPEARSVSGSNRTPAFSLSFV